MSAPDPYSNAAEWLQAERDAQDDRELDLDTIARTAGLVVVALLGALVLLVFAAGFVAGAWFG